MHCLDAAYCYTRRMFCGPCVCVLGTLVSLAIEMFGGQAHVDPGTLYYMGVHIGATCQMQLNDSYVAVMRLYVKLF